MLPAATGLSPPHQQPHRRVRQVQSTSHACALHGEGCGRGVGSGQLGIAGAIGDGWGARKHMHQWLFNMCISLQFISPCASSWPGSISQAICRGSEILNACWVGFRTPPGGPPEWPPRPWAPRWHVTDACQIFNVANVYQNGSLQGTSWVYNLRYMSSWNQHHRNAAAAPPSLPRRPGQMGGEHGAELIPGSPLVPCLFMLCEGCVSSLGAWCRRHGL